MTVYHKIRKILLQNAITVLLQNATEVYCKMRRDSIITKCGSYYKLRRFHYKMRRLLQMRQYNVSNKLIMSFRKFTDQA